MQRKTNTCDVRGYSKPPHRKKGLSLELKETSFSALGRFEHSTVSAVPSAVSAATFVIVNKLIC